MDDLLSLLDGNSQNDEIDDIEKPPPQRKTVPSASTTYPHVIIDSGYSSSFTPTTDTECDMRLKNRQRSHDEWQSTILPHEFQTMPKLAFLSRHALSAFITKPSTSKNQNDGSAFTGGKTNLATLGVLFRNSGTKLSAKGKSAFAILTVGELNSGPVISLFLFGDAYSKHCRLRPGVVMGILEPSVLPSKQGGETALSLSVSDAGQIVEIGTSVDFEMCAAETKSMRNGTLVGGNCRQHVDLRMGRFCSTHSKTRKRNAGSVSFVHKLRAEGIPNPTVKKSMTANPYKRNASQSALFVNAASKKCHPIQQQQQQQQYCQNGFLKKTPMHMKKDSLPRLDRKPPTRLTTNRRIARDMASNLLLGGGSNTKRPLPNATPTPLSNSPHKKRRIAHLEGYDGQVQVPKPGGMFRGRTGSVRQARTNSLHANAESIQMDAERILRNQQTLRATIGETPPKQDHKFMNRKKEVETKDAGLFQQLDNKTRDRLMSTNSKFAKEVDAELYAKNRQVVTELERKEGYKDILEDKKKKGNEGGAIKSEWVCSTCGRKSLKKPISCVLAKHAVKLVREIKRIVNKAENRQEINGKEGKMTLGSGLNWSGWKGNFAD